MPEVEVEPDGALAVKLVFTQWSPDQAEKVGVDGVVGVPVNGADVTELLEALWQPKALTAFTVQVPAPTVRGLPKVEPSLHKRVVPPACPVTVSAELPQLFATAKVGVAGAGLTTTLA